MSESGGVPGAVDVVQSGQGSSRRPPGGRVTVVLGVVAVVAAGAVGFAVGSVVGGGGAQPEDVLPDSVVAYADVDLDPGAGQKLNVARLLGRFPDVKDRYGGEPDVRELLVRQLVAGTPFADVNLGDWVGDRWGVGLVWDAPSQSVTPVAAIAVTDERAAVDDLRALVGGDQVAAVGGYVVITAPHGVGERGIDTGIHPETASEVVAAGADAPLAQSSTWTDGFDQLDDGVASLYLDGDGLAAALQEMASVTGSPVTDDQIVALKSYGVFAAVIRAEPDAIELDGWTSARPDHSVGSPAQLVSDLPASTLVAIEVTGGAATVAERWSSVMDAARTSLSPHRVEQGLAQLEAQYEIRLPDDVQTMAGDDAVLAVDGADLLTGIPGIGLRSLTDPEAATDLAVRLQPTLSQLSGGFGLTARATDDGLVVATSDGYADQLAAADGGLGTLPAFQRALPDVSAAQHVLWVDLAAISAPLALAEPEAANFLSPLESLGATVTDDGDGTRVRVRLVFTEEGS